MSKSASTSLLLIGILLLGMVLRVAPMSQNRFSEDEALYAFWGLQIATGADPMLNQEPVDKPPLHSYLLALSFVLFSSPTPGDQPGNWQGQETAARLPSVFASLLCIALVYALGKTLFEDARVGLVAALLQTLSPFDTLFASTAFTDPLLVAMVLAASLAAAKQRLGVAGFMAGLAVATKQQGFFFVPLVVAIAILTSRHLETQSRKRFGWLYFVAGFAAVVAGVLWWDAARAQKPGFLQQSYVSYGGLGLVPLEDLAARAADWLRLLTLLWVSPWFYGVLFAGLSVWVVGGLLGWWPGWSTTNLVLGAFVGCFLVLHWLVSFQMWDRYLLGIVPLLSLLAARAFVGMLESIRSTVWRRACTLVLGLLLAATMVSPLWQTMKSTVPVGGDHGAYDGIESLAAYMHDQAPDGSVLYHFWLGYHYRFYLYDAPIRLHWYPDLKDLVRDATIYRREPRYIGFASWRDSRPVKSALGAAGITLTPVHDTSRRDGTGSFRLYELRGP